MRDLTTQRGSKVRGRGHLLNEAFFQNHHEEAARILEGYPVEDILRILQGTSPKNAANLLACVTPPVAADTLAIMPTDLLKQVVPHLSPLLAASLFQRLTTICNGRFFSEFLNGMPRKSGPT